MGGTTCLERDAGVLLPGMGTVSKEQASRVEVFTDVGRAGSCGLLPVHLSLPVSAAEYFLPPTIWMGFATLDWVRLGFAIPGIKSQGS